MYNTHSFAKISTILLAGGIGSRMQPEKPKQFLKVRDKAIVRFSFDVFLAMPEIEEIIVVCLPEYRDLFEIPINLERFHKQLKFALPGERRQDSVYNGLMQASNDNNFICIHDGARPFIDEALVRRALEAGISHGAATVGMPIKFTIKQSDKHHFVHSTPDRAFIWEIQTPQVVRKDLLQAGFNYANENNLTVTDDVSLVELLGKEVKLIEGSHTNLKITVPADLTIAENLHMFTG